MIQSNHHDGAGGDNHEKVSQLICVVDDDSSVRRSVGRLLESDGLTVRAFAEPQKFLEFLATNFVRVAILDIWLDHINGLQLFAHLCARSPRTRVIFITGHEDATAELTMKQAGAFAFFIKPFDDTEFLNAVHQALDDFRFGKGQ